MGGRRSARDRSFHNRFVRPLVFGLDAQLQRAHGVFEFCDEACCLFRAATTSAPWGFELSDGVVVRAGDPIIELHLWNEHVPQMTGGAATVAWGSRVLRDFIRSFEQLSHELDACPMFDPVVAIWGDMPFVSRARTDQLLRVCAALGMEKVRNRPAPDALERAHRFAENVLGWLLALAANPGSARLEVLWRDRTAVAMSRATLRRRYGNERPAGARRARSQGAIAGDEGGRRARSSSSIARHGSLV
jgi:hypothetical protein